MAAFYRSNPAIRMINYWPTKDMDACLNLQNRVMSDFTMDYFLAQLRQYLEKNKAELEAAPLGTYAIAPSKPTNGVDPGVIFLLRQTNAQDLNPRQRAASPVHPFSLVYIKNDGTIRYGCAGIRQALKLFEKTADGHAEPIMRLCAQFDSETKNGKDMARYDRLLNAVIAHINGANKSTQVQHLGLRGQRDFKLPTKTQNSTLDFELVTWLVIV